MYQELINSDRQPHQREYYFSQILKKAGKLITITTSTLLPVEERRILIDTAITILDCLVKLELECLNKQQVREMLCNLWIMKIITTISTQTKGKNHSYSKYNII